MKRIILLAFTTICFVGFGQQIGKKNDLQKENLKDKVKSGTFNSQR